MKQQSRVVGLEELNKALADLTPAVNRKITRKALRESAWIITREAQALAKARLHKLTGNLFKGINQGEAKPKRGAGGAIAQAFKIGFTGKAYHGYILEFGTVSRRTKKGKSTGIGPAFRFFTDAWNNKKDEAAELFKTHAVEALEEAAAEVRSK